MKAEFILPVYANGLEPTGLEPTGLIPLLYDCRIIDYCRP